MKVVIEKLNKNITIAGNTQQQNIDLSNYYNKNEINILLQPFVFLQSNELQEWVIAHNKGYRPIVQVFTIGGVEMEADIVHIDNNVIKIFFNVPQKGFAIIR